MPNKEHTPVYCQEVKELLKQGYFVPCCVCCGHENCEEQYGK